MRRYLPSDLNEMQSWFLARRITNPLHPELLPQIGLIEPGIAAGFLYLTDSKLGYLENYITNPKAPARKRYNALNEITSGLFELAKQNGKTHVSAMLSSKAMQREFENNRGGICFGSYRYFMKELH